jgi:uncharacterized oxidoreductase
MVSEVHCQIQPLTSLLRDMLMAEGCGADEAAHTAGHLVDASMRGHDSHGVIRILRYIDWLRDGRITPKAELTCVTDLGTLRQYDAGSGLGQWSAHQFTTDGIALARDKGSAIFTMRRAGHIGRVGAFAQQAAEAGIVSLFFTNVAGSQLVAPFGARAKAGSTAPVTIGIPTPGTPFILDFATSLVAEGKVNVAAKYGKALPADALIDGDGAFSNDPYALYGETLSNAAPTPGQGTGALRAFGAHKGSGLMLACEMLGGSLSGNGANGPELPPFGNGVFAIFVDPAQLENPKAIAQSISDYLGFIVALPTAEGHDQVQVPGMPEDRLYAERWKTGLPIAANVLDDICARAAAQGLAPPLLAVDAAT